MKSRNLVPELMDDPQLDRNEHQRALHGLKRINRLSGTNRRLARAISMAISQSGEKNLIGSNTPASSQRWRILDVGAGGGDVTRSVFEYLTGSDQHCDVVGWDVSPTAVDFANDRFAAETPTASLTFEQRDVLSDLTEAEQPFDVIYCSLFLHHFTRRQAVSILDAMKQSATTAVLVDDLLRTKLGYWLARVGCLLLSRSPIVHFDGPQSVRAAFSRDEALGLAEESGLLPATIQGHWPERFLLTWLNPNPATIPRPITVGGRTDHA